MESRFDPGQLERWNTRFSAEGYLFGKEPNAFLASQRHRLARQGLTVTAFDFSPVGVAKARSLARETGVSVEHREHDIFQWDWEAAQFDAVVVISRSSWGPGREPGCSRGCVRHLPRAGC